MALGLYISVPFCRSKCSFCNFASGVSSRAVIGKYVEKLCMDISSARQTAEKMGAEFEPLADSVYFGGGTPTMLKPEELGRIFNALRDTFQVTPEAEVTVECAPATLKAGVSEALVRCGVNRVSLGVQSFVDAEAAAVGRLHSRAATLDDIARLRSAGVSNISVDLIAGLPHQTEESWRYSLGEVIASGVPHVSVYMLEVDQDSRLGRELIAGGTRYHAHFAPDEDATTEFYLEACRELDAAGIRQYEISNFAREGWQSKHNLKYWTRQPYMGFGVDAHSMLPASTDPYVLVRAEELHGQSKSVEAGGARPCAVTDADVEAVRLAGPDSLEEYLSGAPLMRTVVSSRGAVEEALFLGLRLNRGVDLAEIKRRYGMDKSVVDSAVELRDAGLLENAEGTVVRLTERGRLLSNEVFEKFV